jgi:hypothetical protein
MGRPVWPRWPLACRRVHHAAMPPRVQCCPTGHIADPLGWAAVAQGGVWCPVAVQHPPWNHWYSLKSQGFFWWQRSHDWDGRGHHVALLRDRKARAPPPIARGRVILTRHLWAMQIITMPKSFPSGDRPWSSKWSVMNLRSSKQMAFSGMSSVLNEWSLLVAMAGLGKMNHWSS